MGNLYVNLDEIPVTNSGADLTSKSQDAHKISLKEGTRNIGCSWVQVVTKGLEAPDILNCFDDRSSM